MRLNEKIAKAKQDLYVEKEQKYGKLILAILLWAWLISGTFELLTSTKEIKIVNEAHAETLVSKTQVDVSKLDITPIEGRKEEKESTPTPPIERLISKYFPEVAEKATRVFQCESGLDASKHSGVDVMSDDRTFSVGIAQINLTVSNLNGTDCSRAFQGRNKYAKVIDEKLYEKCVKLASIPKINLQAAKEKYESRGNFQAWQYCDNKTN